MRVKVCVRVGGCVCVGGGEGGKGGHLLTMTYVIYLLAKFSMRDSNDGLSLKPTKSNVGHADVHHMYEQVSV